MLYGNWKSFEELEENLTIEELNEIVTAGLEQEEREHRFFAAIQGIELGKDEQANKFEEVKDRVERQMGERTEKDDFAEFGIDFEVED